ncbi:hypothetical protein [Aquabacterium sp.]|nr:hypothetical protein [Aquabacterium sp.]
MSRARAIQRVKDRFSRDAFPRMQMALHGAQPEVARMPPPASKARVAVTSAAAGHPALSMALAM